MFLKLRAPWRAFAEVPWGLYIFSVSALEMALVVLRQLAVMASVEALDPIALRRRLSTSLPLSVTLVFYTNLRAGYLTYALHIEDARSSTYSTRKLIPLTERTEL